MELQPTTLKIDKKIVKKQRIQDAAIRVMAKQGYHGTTISQIAKAAGVADGTIYLYFENKDDLLLKTIDELMSRFIDEGLQIMERTRSPIERLKKFAELHLKNLSSDEDLIIIFQVELRHNIKFMKYFSENKLRRYFTALEKIIREAQEQNQIRKEIDPWLTAKIFFGALDELTTNWLLSKKNYALTDMAKPTLDIFFHGIFTDPKLVN